MNYCDNDFLSEGYIFRLTLTRYSPRSVTVHLVCVHLAMSAQEFLRSPNWVHRIEAIFAQLDVDKSGYLSLEDWELTISNIEKEINPDPKLLEALRTRMVEYCAAMGLTRGKRLTKEEYVKEMAKMAADEVAKRKRGEEPLLFKVNHAFYDVVDTNHDGHVTLDEYKAILRAWRFGPEAAEESFRVIDTNKNGKIERSELNHHEFNFWFTTDDKESKGMFGENFEK